MPKELPEIALQPGQTIRITGAAPLEYHGNTKRATAVRVTDPRPYVEPVPPPVVIPPPPTLKSVTVASPIDLLRALPDDSLDEIVVKNGTYHVSPAHVQASDSLWIGSKFAARTRPVIVRAETEWGVTFDGGGSGALGAITFAEGAHHQDWRGFALGSFRPTQSGVIVFGGYAGMAAPHHISLRKLVMLPTIQGTTPNNDHLIYFSWAVGGPHDILIEDYEVNAPTVPAGQPGIKSALQFYHSDAANRNAWNVTVRRMKVKGTMSAILMYDGTVHDVLIEDSTIESPRDAALNVQTTGPNVVVRNVQELVSRHGSYYPSGKPAGLTVVGCNFP
jgi:hypothetical protein